MILFVSFWTLFSSFPIPACDNVALVHNGFCNNETNIAECVCHFIETCAAGYHPLVGNGYCDEGTNKTECNYDGGDCCSNSDMVDNGICNDETNNLECNYDGGDCCGPAVSCKQLCFFH